MVPEPELTLVVNRRGTIVGYTIGNDLSCRDIEGENPLYIPQAKIFAGCCALGPVLLAPDDWTTPRTIEMRILGSDGTVVFSGATSTARMRRTILELTEWLTLLSNQVAER